MYRLNVAFAFNPVAEALWNFSIGSLIILPLILAIYVVITDKLVKKNVHISILFLGSIFEFCRGTMATFIFQMVISIIIYLMFSKISRYKLKMR